MISNDNLFKTAKLAFSQNTDNTALNLKSKTVQNTSDSDFKSIFDKTIVNNSTSRANDDAVKADLKLKYQSFRSIKTQQTGKTNQHSVNASGKAKTEDSTEVEKVSDDKKEYNEQINVLAQMLGITPKELVKLAEELGFSAEDFNSVDKLGQMMDKLGDQLLLNDSQKAILAKLSQEVLNQVGEVGADVKSTLTALQSDDVQSNNKIAELSSVAEDIKSKINELLQKSQTGTDSISSEVSKVIAAMKAQAQNHVTLNTAETALEVNNEAVDSVATTINQENLSVEANADSKNSEKAKEIDTDSANDTATSGKTVSQPEVKTVSVQVNTNTDQNDQQALQAFGNIKTQTASNQTEVAKSTFTMPQVKSSEIINQVVEQTKVNISQDKSEIVIQLKPDHLGKLELKVVTEQGIVAAKFIAESQQVKEIIESNMQLLKDSLQKQGISIDGVSVQVGQDKKNEYQQNSYPSKNGSSSSRIAKAGNSLSGVSGTGVNVMDNLPERLAQYGLYDSNEINLTA